MAYIQPTVADIKARFPEFIAVPDALIALLLNEAFDFIGPCWLEKDRAKAQAYFVAHLLALEGEPDRSNSASDGTGGGGTSVRGPVTSEKVGDVQVNYGGGGSSTTAPGGGNGKNVTDALGTTIYGRMLLMLMRLNFPAIAVV